VIAQPSGDILWKSRRAVVGTELKHASAFVLRMTGSDLDCAVPRGLGYFRTHGATGYMHGGVSLQELVVPVMIVRWPRKAGKVPVLLEHVAAVTSVRPRVELRAGSAGRFGFAADEKTVGRTVAVQIVEAASGRRLFHVPAPDAVRRGTSGESAPPSERIAIEPGGEPVQRVLTKVKGEAAPRGTLLRIEVRDADNDEILDQHESELKVDLEEWDD
jgi:hypothetical protein